MLSYLLSTLFIAVSYGENNCNSIVFISGQSTTATPTGKKKKISNSQYIIIKHKIIYNNYYNI